LVNVDVQHAMRMRHVDIYGLLGPRMFFFSTLPHKRQNFQKTSLNMECFFDFVYKLCLKYFSKKK
jgi:hypothetical protein